VQSQKILAAVTVASRFALTGPQLPENRLKTSKKGATWTRRKSGVTAKPADPPPGFGLPVP
jgi:hypothetical protein